MFQTFNFRPIPLNQSSVINNQYANDEVESQEVESQEGVVQQQEEEIQNFQKIKIDDIVNKEILKDQINDLICPICLYLIDDPLYCVKCDANFCKNCILTWTSQQANCPHCRNKNRVNNILFTSSKRRNNNLIDLVQFKCQNNLCYEIIKYSEREKHNKICEYKLIVCPYGSCKKILPKCEIKMHKKSCKFNIQMCKFCHKNVEKTKLKSHIQNCRQNQRHPKDPSYISCKRCGGTISQSDKINHYQSEKCRRFSNFIQKRIIKKFEENNKEIAILLKKIRIQEMNSGNHLMAEQLNEIINLCIQKIKPNLIHESVINNQCDLNFEQCDRESLLLINHQIENVQPINRNRRRSSQIQRYGLNDYVNYNDQSNIESASSEDESGSPRENRIFNAQSSINLPQYQGTQNRFDDFSMRINPDRQYRQLEYTSQQYRIHDLIRSDPFINYRIEDLENRDHDDNLFNLDPEVMNEDQINRNILANPLLNNNQ